MCEVITNDVFKNALRYTGKLGTLASEEEDEPVDGSRATDADGSAVPVLSEEFADTGKYICVFDPLDGSSNVDAGIPVGTIFGVFQEPDAAECELPEDLSQGLSEDQQRCLAGTLQPGKAAKLAFDPKWREHETKHDEKDQNSREVPGLWTVF